MKTAIFGIKLITTPKCCVEDESVEIEVKNSFNWSNLDYDNSDVISGFMDQGVDVGEFNENIVDLPLMDIKESANV